LIEWPSIVDARTIQIKTGDVLGHVGELLVHGKGQADSGKI
jgi:hypothetical protein